MFYYSSRTISKGGGEREENTKHSKDQGIDKKQMKEGENQKKEDKEKTP